MSVAHSTDQTVVNCHAEFNRLAFGIDLDGNPLPYENGFVLTRFGHTFLGNTSNVHPQYQRTTAPNGQNVVVSTKQNAQDFEGCIETD